MNKRDDMKEKKQKKIIEEVQDKHKALKIAKQIPRGREETVSGRSGN